MASVAFSLCGLAVGVWGAALLAVRLGPFVHEVHFAITLIDDSIHTLARDGDRVVYEGLSGRVKRAMQFGQVALVRGFRLLALSFVLQGIALVLRLIQEGVK
jgi:hypothetical protein